MKICFLAKTKRIHTERWINYFAKCGHEVTLITCYPINKNLHIDERVHIRRIWFPPHSIARYGALLEIIRIIREIQPDIIHAHYISHFGILAGMYKKISGFSPIVLTAWGSDILKDPNFLNRKQIKNTLNQVELITCDAIHMKEIMEKEFNVDADKIKLINFGTDIDKFCPKPKTNIIHQRWKLNDGPIVISTRWLMRLYDIETLIRAIPIIKKEISNVHFIIGGEGPEEKNLKNLSIKLGVEHNITFTGFIQNDELPLYLTDSSVYVSTSLSDAGIAASTAEAMACGLPVVITDFGNNNQWISDGEGGFLFPVHDYQALAIHIINLLKNKELMKKCGERNHNLILEYNNYFITMKKVEEMYQKLLEGRKK